MQNIKKFAGIGSLIFGIIGVIIEAKELIETFKEDAESTTK